MNASFNKYLWKNRIDISQFTEPDNHSVTLREPNTAEFRRLVKLQDLINKEAETDSAQLVGDVYDTFCELCCTLITEHDFIDDDSGNRIPSKDVAEFVGSKLDMAQYILTQYLTSLPLLNEKSKK